MEGTEETGNGGGLKKQGIEGTEETGMEGTEETGNGGD
jgi:hypothetical protein